MNCLLSIIIPTKDRHETLFPVVEYLSEISCPDLEIVIQDNSLSNEKAIQFLEELKNPKVKYFYSGKNLSVIENSDLAVGNAKGKFICFIGDDDGVMPYIVDVVKWMDRNKIDAVRGVKPFYTWPGLKSSFLEKNKSGVLKYSKFANSSIQINPGKVLNQVLKKGGTDMLLLPCLYHGIVSKEILGEIHRKTNSYFPGPSPDMANAVALSFYVSKYYYLNIPVVVSGKCIASTGGQGVLHKHVAKIEDVAHLPANTAANWPDEIPKYWTGPTIWAASLVDALKRMGYSTRIKDINFTYLYAKLFVYNFSHRSQIFKDFKAKNNTIEFSLICMFLFLKRSFLIGKRKSGLNKDSKVTNIKCIREAIQILDKEVRLKKLFFEF